MPAPPAAPLTVLDQLGGVVGGLTSIALLSFPILGRTFASMFEDLGGGELPRLTRLAISSWMPMLLGAISGAVLTLAFRRGLAASRRRLWIACACLWGCLGFALCIVGLYLPIFRMASAIRG